MSQTTMRRDGRTATVVQVGSDEWNVVSGNCIAVSAERVVSNGWGEQEVEHSWETEAEAVEAAQAEGWVVQ
ncbi:MAG: hypothetical protein ACRD1P_06975 [Thermoanaerobaculia bacterium]